MAESIYDWDLQSWKDSFQYRRFRSFLAIVLEQWERGFFHEELDFMPSPLLASAYMLGIPWWFPKLDLDELPWSRKEVDLILERPDGLFSWRLAYRDKVAKQSLEAGRWSPQIQLVTKDELQLIKERREPLIPVIEPPPFFPVYDPSKPVHDGIHPPWDERVEQIKRLYKERVEEAMKAHGFETTPKRQDPRHYEWLALRVLKDTSFYSMSQEEGATDRRNISRHVKKTAELVGIELLTAKEKRARKAEWEDLFSSLGEETSD